MGVSSARQQKQDTHQQGELLAVAEALEKTRYFTLGSPDLTLGVDHKPLLGILNDDDISKIKNPRIRRLKERILQWGFNVKYVPGKLLGGTDALSRYGVKPDVDDLHASCLMTKNPECTSSYNWQIMMKTNTVTGLMIGYKQLAPHSPLPSHGQSWSLNRIKIWTLPSSWCMC